MHLTSEPWTGPFTTSKQLTLSLVYLLPLFAPKPRHLCQVRFSTHLLFQRVGRSQDQSVPESWLWHLVQPCLWVTWGAWESHV